jgi:hypothetical protein
MQNEAGCFCPARVAGGGGRLKMSKKLKLKKKFTKISIKWKNKLEKCKKKIYPNNLPIIQKYNILKIARPYKKLKL